MPNRQSPGLPNRQQILDFIASSDTPAGKREIARAFGLHAQDKILLKALLKDMADEGLIDSAPGRAFHKMGGVPKVTVLRIVDVTEEGVPIAVPENWDSDQPPPRLRVVVRGKRDPLGPGDRILSRTEEAGSGWLAHPMKKLARGEELVLGVLRREGDRLWLKPVDKREKRDWLVSDAGEADVGDLVLAEKAGRPPRMTVRVTERLGDPFAPRSFSLVAIHKFGIPDVFSEEVLAEATAAAKLPLGEGREDLTHLPIVAIDPSDARDHDDAVWATPDEDTGNAGGYRAIVAIADVAYYVRAGSELDRSARKRGNSVYFPDRVVPMLPEILSADVCSLKEGVDRAALACHLRVGADGTLKGWHFTRATVRIAANIAYEDAQAAIDGEAGRVPAELVEEALKPLWACWRLFAGARERRGPLDLDMPERRVELDETGRIASVAPRERLDSMRLIEEYMIAANVAAAKALESKKQPVMYRDHEPPSREKLVALKEYLETCGVSFALGQVVRPETFNHLLARVEDAAMRPQIMEQILRSQTQAYYAPANTGHFGLALGSYAHFTSPIRRYADLLVHRSLVGAFGLAPAVEQTRLPAADAERMPALGEAISRTERRAMEAERETIDRYVAAYLTRFVGEVVDTRITGVRAFGFFATVQEIGGDGLVPVSTLGAERFTFDEAAQALVGDESGDRYVSGQLLKLRLVEADPISGALRFEPVEGANHLPHRRHDSRDRPRTGKPGRPRNIRHHGGR
ncbi:ribonuclease R family protein [Sphingomonas prati]|uniref:Ribonuclease R n=1 Tax=Sphingomonas prati TaxID=1843237 RepID=A0A7W9BP69_9SPHN|nr:VacB/RNase II family 3'-5' exoribonuclease [Sphingomonas prati]MBB5727582.1 ribonuclease R [Sphingomonas prati]GGE79158.1 ribonuclease R [Sphingomonas prati]